MSWSTLLGALPYPIFLASCCKIKLSLEKSHKAQLSDVLQGEHHPAPRHPPNTMWCLTTIQVNILHASQNSPPFWLPRCNISRFPAFLEHEGVSLTPEYLSVCSVDLSLKHLMFNPLRFLIFTGHLTCRPSPMCPCRLHVFCLPDSLKSELVSLVWALARSWVVIWPLIPSHEMSGYFSLSHESRCGCATPRCVHPDWSTSCCGVQDWVVILLEHTHKKRFFLKAHTWKPQYTSKRLVIYIWQKAYKNTIGLFFCIGHLRLGIGSSLKCG